MHGRCDTEFDAAEPANLEEAPCCPLCGWHGAASVTWSPPPARSAAMAERSPSTASPWSQARGKARTCSVLGATAGNGVNVPYSTMRELLVE